MPARPNIIFCKFRLYIHKDILYDLPMKDKLELMWLTVRGHYREIMQDLFPKPMTAKQCRHPMPNRYNRDGKTVCTRCHYVIYEDGRLLKEPYHV